MYKKVISLDFDGVIHSYTSQWLEADFIPDPPVPRALVFIKSILESTDYELKIYSSRNNQDGGIRAMQNYLRFWFIKEYGWEVGAGIGNKLRSCCNLLSKDHNEYWNHFPLTKPSAFLSIDDRAMLFTGTFPSFEEINAFKPWNKK